MGETTQTIGNNEVIDQTIRSYGDQYKDFENKALNLDKSDHAELAKFQYLSQKTQQAAQFLTNIMQTMHEMNMSFIRNLRGH